MMIFNAQLWIEGRTNVMIYRAPQRVVKLINSSCLLAELCKHTLLQCIFWHFFPYFFIPIPFKWLDERAHRLAVPLATEKQQKTHKVLFECYHEDNQNKVLGLLVYCHHWVMSNGWWKWWIEEGLYEHQADEMSSLLHQCLSNWHKDGKADSVHLFIYLTALQYVSMWLILSAENIFPLMILKHAQKAR